MFVVDSFDKVYQSVIASVSHERLSGSGEENCVGLQERLCLNGTGPPWNHFLLQPCTALPGSKN
jgi:hypothetical protein